MPLSARQAATEQPGNVAAPATLAPRRILVVDDNTDAADSLAKWLALQGHSVRAAADATCALREASAFRPEVVFIDIGLPDIDGWELAMMLRAQYGNPNPLLVALTGYGSEEDVARSRAAGFDRHLVKPVERAALDSVLAAPIPRRCEAQRGEVTYQPPIQRTSRAVTSARDS